MAGGAFKIDGVEYEFPTGFRLGDTVLVEKLTGLEFAEFAERVDRGAAGQGDMVILTGFIGVAVWQKNPLWLRDRVVGFVERVSLDAFEAVAEAMPVGETEAALVPPLSPSPEQSDESIITVEDSWAGSD